MECDGYLTGMGKKLRFKVGGKCDERFTEKTWKKKNA
jgi:hypothetical protein